MKEREYLASRGCDNFLSFPCLQSICSLCRRSSAIAVWKNEHHLKSKTHMQNHEHDVALLAAQFGSKQKIKRGLFNIRKHVTTPWRVLQAGATVEVKSYWKEFGFGKGKQQMRRAHRRGSKLPTHPPSDYTKPVAPLWRCWYVHTSQVPKSGDVALKKQNSR